MLEILTVLDSIDNYKKYKDIVSKHITDYDIKRIIDSIGIYYTDTAVSDIVWTDFTVWFFVKNPLIKDTKKVMFESMFTKLTIFAVTSGTLKSSLVDTFLERYHAERIAFLAMEVAEGKKSDLTNVQLELDEYLTVSGKAAKIEAEAVTEDLVELLDTTTHSIGLNWRLNALNESLGPLRQGNFCMFPARPEAGKTTLLCSETTFMAKQLPEGKKVIYFTNEEGGRAVKIRLHCSLLGVTYNDLLANPPFYKARYATEMGGDKDKIIVVDKHDLHMRDIEYWLNKTDVGLICIDQLRKVHGFEDMGGIQRLERMFQTAREWSKEYAPVLTVGQLDATAENEQYPTMSRLYESKTAVQGECDVIVNIGSVDGSIPANARWLNVVKNKLPTPGVPALRHGRHEVLILPEIARFV